MAELQFTQPETGRVKKINKKVESKVEKQYLFADEAEKQRQEKQYLRDSAFENMKNILKNDDIEIRFNDIVKDIYRVCFGDLVTGDFETSLRESSEVNDESDSSIHDVISKGVLQKLMNEGILTVDDEVGRGVQDQKKVEVSGKENISSHVMYRVLVGARIDGEVHEQNRAFVYDYRDEKVEGILKKFEQVTNESELADLEDRLLKDEATISNRDDGSNVSNLTH